MKKHQGKKTHLTSTRPKFPIGNFFKNLTKENGVAYVHLQIYNQFLLTNIIKITSLNIFKACLRLRPDRIFLSELRGSEVWPFLRAANSGDPGSLSTLHADSPEGAFTQLVFMMQQAGSTSTEEQLKQYLKSIIHIIIQLKRDPECFVRVDDIWFA